MLSSEIENDSRRRDRFYRRLFESSEDCIKILSLQGDLLEMSEHGQQLLEIPDINPFLNTPWVSFWRDPEHRAAAETALVSARAGTAASFTGHFITFGGTPKWFHVLVSPVFDEAGIPECLLSVSRDITKQIEAEHELRERYDREHRLMVELQRALLPAALPEIDGLTFDAVYVPATPALEVGGDWYDAFRLDDGRVVISVGDVCGHGLNAAIVMQQTWQSIRAFALIDRHSPAEILKHANDVLRHQYPDIIVTAWLGILEGESLTYASAGHPWPLLQRADGTIEVLSGSAPPLGLLDGRDHNAWNTSVTLKTAKTLVLFTDGLTEMTRNATEGEGALRDALTQLHAHDTAVSAGILKDRLVSGSPQDDIAILTVGFNA